MAPTSKEEAREGRDQIRQIHQWQEGKGLDLTPGKVMTLDAGEEPVYQLIDETPIVELLAEQRHNSWAGWARWMIDHIDGVHPSGETYRERWERQIRTPYTDLSEKEKESDRIEVRKDLPILRAWMHPPILITVDK